LYTKCNGGTKARARHSQFSTEIFPSTPDSRFSDFPRHYYKSWEHLTAKLNHTFKSIFARRIPARYPCSAQFTPFDEPELFHLGVARHRPPRSPNWHPIDFNCRSSDPPHALPPKLSNLTTQTPAAMQRMQVFPFFSRKICQIDPVALSTINNKLAAHGRLPRWPCRGARRRTVSCPSCLYQQITLRMMFPIKIRRCRASANLMKYDCALF
jgi:hypothetical protein